MINMLWQVLSIQSQTAILRWRGCCRNSCFFKYRRGQLQNCPLLYLMGYCMFLSEGDCPQPNFKVLYVWINYIRTIQAVYLESQPARDSVEYASFHDCPCRVDYGYDIAIQPNGKIVAVGSSYAPSMGNSDFAILSYNTNGSLDATFSEYGKQTNDFGGAVTACMAVLQSGRMASSLWQATYTMSQMTTLLPIVIFLMAVWIPHSVGTEWSTSALALGGRILLLIW